MSSAFGCRSAIRRLLALGSWKMYVSRLCAAAQSQIECEPCHRTNLSWLSGVCSTPKNSPQTNPRQSLSWEKITAQESESVCKMLLAFAIAQPLWLPQQRSLFVRTPEQRSAILGTWGTAEVDQTNQMTSQIEISPTFYHEESALFTHDFAHLFRLELWFLSSLVTRGDFLSTAPTVHWTHSLFVKVEKDKRRAGGGPWEMGYSQLYRRLTKGTGWGNTGMH